MFMWVWLLYAILSLAWVKDYASWSREFFFLGIGVFCVVAYSKVLTSKADVVSAFRAMSVMVVFNNILGWYELMTGNYIFSTVNGPAYALLKRPAAMFHNTNDFATYLLISICILYVCAVQSKRQVSRMFYLVVLFSSGVLLVQTKSRGNIFGLLLMVATFICLSVRHRRRRKVLLHISAIVLATFLLLPNNISLSYLVNEIQLMAPNVAVVGSDLKRLNTIKNGFRFLGDTYGFGTGAGNIPHWMATHAVYPTYGITEMHNWWMEVFTGYGLLIGVLYLSFYYRLSKNLYQSYRRGKNREDTAISLGLLCGMVGFVIGSFSSSSTIGAAWLWMFWGVAIAHQNNTHLSLRVEPTSGIGCSVRQ
jgi:teichuronic acid biosynthesis protein TuaE